MAHPRYGKFRFRDYISGWFAIIFFLVIVIDGYLTNTLVHLLIWPLFLSMIMAWSIYKPNRERFIISDNIITIIQGRKEQKVIIPSEITLVVSYADVYPPLAKRVGGVNQTYVLKGRYAVSILHKVPLERVLECLHKNYARKYFMSTIEERFNEQTFIYSFVCNRELLDDLLVRENYQLIIPESLLKMVFVNQNTANVYVDVGY